jgi:hypothetical protein
MPTAEYRVYVSSSTLAHEIEEYCAKHDLSESAFFREAARERIQKEAADDE